MHENLSICEVDKNNFIKNLINYTIAWFALVWLQFVFQFDEEVIAWTCNYLQKKLSNSLRYCKKKLKNSYIKTFERPKDIKKSDDSLLRNYWNKTKYIWLNNREI